MNADERAKTMLHLRPSASICGFATLSFFASFASFAVRSGLSMQPRIRRRPRAHAAPRHRRLVVVLAGAAEDVSLNGRDEADRRADVLRVPEREAEPIAADSPVGDDDVAPADARRAGDHLV